MSLEIGFPCASVLFARCRWFVLFICAAFCGSDLRMVSFPWPFGIFLTLYQMNLKARRAVWISTFRRPSLLIKLFSFSWTSITINQLRRCLASRSFRIQGRLDSGLWGPSRADYGGLCASPRTFGDRVQLDRQVHIEDRRGRVVTMRKWSLYHLRSQWSDRWISYKLTHKISRHRKPTASGWSELPRTTPLKIA